jgi:hypothetical protein
LKKGYAHSLSDLDNDFIPDLVYTVNLNKDKTAYEQWSIRNKAQYEFDNSYDAPDALVYGQSLFADFGNYLIV